jgi:hypothetical protein
MVDYIFPNGQVDPSIKGSLTTATHNCENRSPSGLLVHIEYGIKVISGPIRQRSTGESSQAIWGPGESGGIQSIPGVLMPLDSVEESCLRDCGRFRDQPAFGEQLVRPVEARQQNSAGSHPTGRDTPSLLRAKRPARQVHGYMPHKTHPAQNPMRLRLLRLGRALPFLLLFLRQHFLLFRVFLLQLLCLLLMLLLD